MSKAKVLLFTLPPSGGDLFPVSLGYIAASLKKNGFETAIAEIDKVTTRTGQSITNFVLAFKPVVIGFTVYQSNIKLAIQLAKLIKMIDPSLVVVFGGPQATFMPGKALVDMPAVDVIVKGEGEVVIPALVKCLSSQGDITKVKGIVFRGNDGIYETLAQPLALSLDSFSSPYQSGVFNFSDHSVATMLASRGCNFNCSFCYTPRAFSRSIRAHSSRRVLDDMSVCIRNGIKRFFFADPSFTFDRRRVQLIMRGIIRARWKVEIWCETRTDLVDAKLLALMARAGVTHIAYGLESVDPKVNKMINKRINIVQFEETIRTTQSLGIEVEVFTLYGLPKQTVDSCLSTLNFLKRLKVQITGNSAGQQLVLFFGTDILNHPQRYGIRLLKKGRPLYLSAGIDFVTDCMSKRDIAYVAKKYKDAEKLTGTLGFRVPRLRGVAGIPLSAANRPVTQCADTRSSDWARCVPLPRKDILCNYKKRNKIYLCRKE